MKKLTKNEIEEILEDEAMERYYEAKEMEKEAVFDDDLVLEDEE